MFGFSNKLKFAPSDKGDIVYISMNFLQCASSILTVVV